MNFRMNATAFMVAAGVMLAGSVAVAESTYGYKAAGTGPISATAKVNVNVTIPLLVLLKVGTAGSTVDTITLTASATGMTTDGNSNAASWNGAAPAFTFASTTNNIGVAAWTNAPANASLTCSPTTPFATGAPAVSVAGTGTLNHPGADTSCGSAVTVSPNVVAQDTWTYSMTSAAMAAAKAGSYNETVTYTITTL